MITYVTVAKCIHIIKASSINGSVSLLYVLCENEIVILSEGPKGFSVIHPSPWLSGGKRGT